MADVSQIKLPNGSVYDLIDEKSGYITAEYIENKTDYSIPVSRVGEIVVGETAIGTDSTNFPTSKAVVDYVDERVVQEMDAIDVGVTGIKANGTSLSVVDGIVNIPAIGPNQSVGLMTDQWMQLIWNSLDSIPTSTSQLTNDSGFITSETDPTVPAWAKAATKPTYTASEVGALPSDTVIPEDKIFIAVRGTTTYNDILAAINAGKVVFCKDGSQGVIWRFTGNSGSSTNGTITFERIDGIDGAESMHSLKYLQLSRYSGQERWSVLTRTIPYRTSDLTNDSGYLTASDIASVMTYKGTKANYAALPSTGNTTGDVWHLTDTGAEWAWDGSAWQELGTAIDLSNYLTTSDIAAWAKASTKPTYTAAEVGALPDSTVIPSKTSDLTNDSGFITGYTETDPIFSASAASGITATDISNWNGKSDTDEKLKISNISVTSAQTYYLIFGDNSTSVATRQYDATGLCYQVSTNYSELMLGCYNPNKQGKITLFNSGYYKTLRPSTFTSSGTILLPDANGTIALTSDIPQVYSSTNTGGYLTMATLPIYDGTVE